MSSALVSYIDPGTGSMLFTLVIGLLSAGYFVLRNVVLKLKFLASGGRADAKAAGRMEYVIFSDHKRYWNVFEPICDELERRGIDCAFWTASPDDPALHKPYTHVACEFIGEGNKAFARLNMMNAVVCLATTPGLDVYQWKRSKEVDWYVHTFHTVGTAVGYRMFGMDFFDAVLLAGDFQEREIREIEGLRGIPAKELTMVGCTYLDSMAARLREEGSRQRVGNGGLHVLLAPSWGPNGILTVYGERIIDAILEAGFELVIRPHPQSQTADREVLDALMARYQDDRRVSWNYDNDNFAILDWADVMITDFSGVIFDYTLVFDKPVIYTEANYDTALYDAAWLESPQWRFEVYPTLGIPLDESQFPHMRDVIERVVADKELKAGRDRARAEAWAYPGEGAQRTVDYLVAKHDEIVAAQAAEAAELEAQRNKARRKHWFKKKGDSVPQESTD